MSQSKVIDNNLSHTLQLDAEGRVTLPEVVREQMGLTEGDRLLLRITEQGDIQLVSLRQQVKKLRGILKNPEPTKSIVDELIQDRRREGRSE